MSAPPSGRTTPQVVAEPGRPQRSLLLGGRPRGLQHTISPTDTRLLRSPPMSPTLSETSSDTATLDALEDMLAEDRPLPTDATVRSDSLQRPSPRLGRWEEGLLRRRAAEEMRRVETELGLRSHLRMQRMMRRHELASADQAEDDNYCTLCCDAEPIWCCPACERKTRICKGCVARLVDGMTPSDAPHCPRCRMTSIPAKLIEEHLPQTVVEKYRTRRSAGIRGDANQWLQSAVRALIAGEPAPQPWLPSSKASRPVRGHSPAETTYESALMDRLGGEAQQQVQRKWERLRSISYKETLTKELTRLEDESLAIACPSAKMCPRCNYGPVLKTGCDDLAQHHGERQTSNCCRGCGFFGFDSDVWKAWDFVNRLDLPNGPVVETDVTRLVACAGVSEAEAAKAIKAARGNLDAAFDFLLRQK